METLICPNWSDDGSDEGSRMAPLTYRVRIPGALGAFLFPLAKFWHCFNVTSCFVGSGSPINPQGENCSLPGVEK